MDNRDAWVDTRSANGNVTDDPVTQEADKRRADPRTIDGGKATAPEREEMLDDRENQRHVGESGSQGSKLGREDQNPITTSRTA